MSDASLEAAVRALLGRGVPAETIEDRVWRLLSADVEGLGVIDSASGPERWRALRRAVARAMKDGSSRAEVLVRAHEQALRGESRERRKKGAFYTPVDVAERITAITLDPLLDSWERASPPPIVMDPACGAGVFVRAAFRRIFSRLTSDGGMKSADARRVALASVRGVDASVRAVRIARRALWLEIADPSLAFALLRRSIRVGDGLGRWPSGVAAVVGNPPFLGQLKTRTVQTRSARAGLRRRFGRLVGAYTDPAAVFLARSIDGVIPGGRVGLIQPTSTLAARDAAAVRACVEASAWCDWFWAMPSGIFDASVSACAMVWNLVPPTPRASTVIVTGRAGARESSQPWCPGGSWAGWLARAMGTPQARRVACHGCIEDLAEVAADFRDQYYGLRGAVEEIELARSTPDVVPLLITAHVDVGTHRWGEVDARLLGQRWLRPGARVPALRARGLGGFVDARCVPKVVVATQTRVIEACVDEQGRFLPVVPLISITPRGEADLWRLAAAVLAPVNSLRALERCAGAGLSSGAIKLSASGVRRIELPGVASAWDASALSLRRLAEARHDERPQALRAFGAESLAAFGLGGAAARRILHWWLSRQA